MARQLDNGKWNPVVYSNGYVGMTNLVDEEWKTVEYDTKEEAEAKEKGYLFAINGISKGRKYFKMNVNGNIYNDHGEIALFNLEKSTQ